MNSLEDIRAIRRTRVQAWRDKHRPKPMTEAEWMKAKEIAWVEHLKVCNRKVRGNKNCQNCGSNLLWGEGLAWCWECLQIPPKERDGYYARQG